MSKLALSGGKPVRERPFPAWPVFDAREEKLMLEVLRSGQWWRYTLGEALDPTAGESSQRSKVADFQERFAAMHGSQYGIACANGTAALEVALRALGVGPGDEVIVPPYTFIATATAPMLIGATPVFCDIDLATLNLDPARLEEAITPRTKAIVPVHFAGLAADMDAIGRIAARHGIAVIEDAAHAHGGYWNGRPLGSIGAAATFSFQASKNMTAGEGGLITTNDPAVAEICESLVWVGRKMGRPVVRASQARVELPVDGVSGGAVDCATREIGGADSTPAAQCRIPFHEVAESARHSAPRRTFVCDRACMAHLCLSVRCRDVWSIARRCF